MIRESFLRHFWISKTVLALYAPLSLSAVPAALLHLEVSSLSVVIIAVIVTAFAIAMLSTLFLFGQTKLSFRKRALTYLAAIAVVGALRGALLYVLCDVFNVDDQVSLPVRILNSTIFTLLWLVAITTMVALTREGAFRYEQHFTQRAIEASREIHASPEDLARQIDSMSGIRQLQNNLQRILHTLDKSEYREQELLVAASRIKAEVEGSLRPLSHKIWFSETLTRPRFRGLGVLREALETPRFSPVTSAVVFWFWFAFGSAALMSFWGLMVGALISAVSIFVLTSWANKLTLGMKFHPVIGTLLLGCISSLSYATLVIGMAISFPGEFGGNTESRDLIFPLGALLVLIVTSVFLAMRENFKLLEALVDSAATLTSKRLSSEFASYLHNTLQSELTNLALTLERAAEKADKYDVQLRERLEQITTRSIGSDFTSRSFEPEDRLLRVIQAWSGIIDVKFDPRDLDSIPDSHMAVFAELIEESISNAVRHAEAAWMEIECQVTDSGTEVRITNPAALNSTETKSLGTRWLESNFRTYSVTEDSSGNRRTQILL